jgi:hypothetical protein
MHGLVLALFASILVVEYLVERRGLLHPYFVLMPEVLSGVVMLVVLLKLMNGARFYFDWRYGVVLTVLLFTIAFGFVVQDVQAGAMLAGLRAYVKFLPFFLLPAVHRFTPRQLQVQLAMVLVLALLQPPLAFYQRFVEFGDSMHTGDPVRGTLTTSSVMSLFMLAAVAAVVVLYLRGRLRLAPMLALCAWLFAATTINETKATLLLLPVALLLPVLLMPGKGRAMRRLVPLLAIGALATTVFVSAYNYFGQYRQYSVPIGEFFSGEALRYYVYTGAANTDQPYIGRFDSIEIALEHTTADPLTFAFGYGAGNVSESFLPQFSGAYSDYYLRFGVGQTQITHFLWEIGVVGTLAYLFLYYVVARDALRLARSKDPAAPIGQFWAVVVVIMTFALLYKSVLSMNDSGYLFWYFSGLVASRAAAVRHGALLRGAPQRAPPSWRLAVEGPRAAAKT